MHYGKIIYCDVANGIGCRTSLFVSGCRHHCKNCFNQITWNFDYGDPYTEDTKEHIIKSIDMPYIQGLTILGGEPLEPENQTAVLDLCKTIKERLPEKTIWIYSGYTFEQITGTDDTFKHIATPESIANCKEILNNIDVLVDGPFVQDLYDITLKYRGSSNQRIIDVKKTLTEHSVCLYLK